MASHTPDPDSFKLIPFPEGQPTLKHPIGHDQYQKDRFHGRWELNLKVKKSVHVSTGVVVLGKDVDSKVDLIKTMLQEEDKRLIIPGSSLKGAVRSIYEAITNSTLGVKSEYERKIPAGRTPCKGKTQLCPASRVFGALNWQGVIEFQDARCQLQSIVGYMPSLYRPHPEARQKYYPKGKLLGRKFYYVNGPTGSRERKIPVQQSGRDYLFTTTLRFKNLAAAELGALAIALGQDPDYPMALKLGGGKSIGMGTVEVEIASAQVGQDLRSRYSAYQVEMPARTGQPLQTDLQEAMQAAHRELIQKRQLEELAKVLKLKKP